MALVELGGMAEGEGLVEIFLGAIFVVVMEGLVVVVKRNGLELLVVASLVGRSVVRSLATQAPAGFLPNAPGFLRVIRCCCMTREAEVFHHQWMASKMS